MGKPGQVRLWDSRSGKPVRTLSANVDKVQSVTFTPDGQRVVGGAGQFDSMLGTMKLGGTGVVPIWDVQSGQLVRSLTCHVEQVAAVACSADSKWIVTGGTGPTGGEVKIWDAVSGKELRTLKSHAGDVFALAVFPDGKRVVAGCQENVAIIWAL